jgi:hypothetical protein
VFLLVRSKISALRPRVVNETRNFAEGEPNIKPPSPVIQSVHTPKDQCFEAESSERNEVFAEGVRILSRLRYLYNLYTRPKISALRPRVVNETKIFAEGEPIIKSPSANIQSVHTPKGQCLEAESSERSEIFCRRRYDKKGYHASK